MTFYPNLLDFFFHIALFKISPRNSLDREGPSNLQTISRMKTKTVQLLLEQLSVSTVIKRAN